jgi:uncharacterized protein YjbI with pentapeptide repeats
MYKQIKIMKRKRAEKNNLIESPELPQEDSAEVLLEGQLYELESYENIWVSNCKLSGVRGVSINKAYFQNVQIYDTQFPRFDLRNIRFDKCDFANTELEKASLNQVELINCRLVGFPMMNSHIKNTLIRDCHGKFAQFEFTKFKAARFENCDLEDSNFQNADLSNVVFLNCNMRNAMLHGAKLIKTDFRGSNIENLQINLEQLRETVIEPLQAIYLLQRYAGVIVKDSESDSL